MIKKEEEKVNKNCFNVNKRNTKSTINQKGHIY